MEQQQQNPLSPIARTPIKQREPYVEQRDPVALEQQRSVEQQIFSQMLSQLLERFSDNFLKLLVERLQAYDPTFEQDQLPLWLPRISIVVAGGDFPNEVYLDQGEEYRSGVFLFWFSDAVQYDPIKGTVTIG